MALFGEIYFEIGRQLNGLDLQPIRQIGLDYFEPPTRCIR